jgi:hypothetical protein
LHSENTTPTIERQQQNPEKTYAVFKIKEFLNCYLIIISKERSDVDMDIDHTNTNSVGSLGFSVHLVFTKPTEKIYTAEVSNIHTIPETIYTQNNTDKNELDMNALIQIKSYCVSRIGYIKLLSNLKARDIPFMCYFDEQQMDMSNERNADDMDVDGSTTPQKEFIYPQYLPKEYLLSQKPIIRVSRYYLSSDTFRKRSFKCAEVEFQKVEDDILNGRLNITAGDVSKFAPIGDVYLALDESSDTASICAYTRIYGFEHITVDNLDENGVYRISFGCDAQALYTVLMDIQAIINVLCSVRLCTFL